MTVPDASTGREYKRDDAGPDRRPATRAARRPARRLALPRPAAFWLLAGVLFLPTLRCSPVGSGQQLPFGP